MTVVASGGDSPAAARHHAGLWLCLGGAAIGLIGLLGWMTGSPSLTTLVPGLPPMMPNTALGLLLIGGAAAARHTGSGAFARRALSMLAIFVVLAIGVGTILEYVVGIDLHILSIGQLFVTTPAALPPRRSSMTTALALTLQATALLLVDVRPHARFRPSEGLVLWAALVAFTGLTGIILGAEPIYGSSNPATGFSLATATGLMLTSLGLLLGSAGGGAMRAAASPGPGGGLLRRMALPVLILPIVLGLGITRIAEMRGVTGSEVPVALLAAAMTAVNFSLLLLNAGSLNRAHEEIQASHTRIGQLVEHAPDGMFVADVDGRYIDVNEAGCRLLGFTREEILSRTIADLLPPDDVGRLWEAREALLRGDVQVREWTLVHKDGHPVPTEISTRIQSDGRWQAVVRDISDRKRLESKAQRASERLRESEERFRLTLDEAPIGMSIVSLDGRLLRVNRALCEILGYRPEELTGMTVRDITHPDDGGLHRELIDQLLRGDIHRFQVERRYRRKDGTSVDARLSGSLLHDQSGKPLHFIGQVEDITARKRLDDELRLSEAKATGILSISADAIISTDDEQRITQFNEGAEKIFGYSTAEAIGAPLAMLIPERFRAAHGPHVARFASSPDVARKMGPGGATIMGVRKNGNEFSADATISKFEVGGRRVFTVAVRDVTEQRRIENEQRLFAGVGSALATTLEYEETATRVAEAVVDSFSDYCIVDVIDAAGEVRRLSVVSRHHDHDAICDTLRLIPAGRPRPVLIERVLESRQPTVIQRPAAADLDGLSYGDQHRQALEGIAAQSLMIIPLVARGRLLGALTFLSARPCFVDARADLRTAQEIAHLVALGADNSRLYREAQRATQVRDEVLGIVAHDLRNPLAMVLMEAKLLGDSSYKPERRSAQPGERIHRAAMRMSRLIQDLLDVTRLEAGRLPLEPSPMSAAQIASDATDVQVPLAAAAALELRLELSPDLPAIVADRDRLLQVFENLIGNAIKFTPPQGSVTVGASSNGGSVRFSVRDTGPGIPLEDQPHLFDRFWQARTARHGGAGLGLPIVKGIIEAHGGVLWVESALGSGAAFFFTVPTVQARSRLAVVSDGPASPA